MPSNRRLHDKLIIVDGRYVVEGSTNWSVSALKSNFESATLIDSTGLARIKLLRVENLTKASKGKEKRLYTPVYLENLPKTLTIPKELLLNEGYVSKMVSSNDRRSLDLYLLLLAHSQTVDKKEFFISLESMALSLGMSDTWTYTALRRQIIKSLKKLQYRYSLIETEFFYGRDAALRLNVIARDAKQSQAFPIPTNSVIASEAKQSQLTMRSKFFLLAEAFLKAEEEDIDNISIKILAKRFGVSESVFYQARKDLDKKGTVLVLP